MINVDTFKMLYDAFEDKDYVLKVIQANVIMSKSAIEPSDMQAEGNFLKRLVAENAHNGILKEHYDFAVELYIYQEIKDLNGLGGSKAIFPKVNS